MLVEHTLTICARCPVNNSHDVYTVTFRLDRFVQVEELVAAAKEYKARVLWQEDLTQELADRFQCEVESHGHHKKVSTKVVCCAVPGQRDDNPGPGTAGPGV